MRSEMYISLFIAILSSIVQLVTSYIFPENYQALFRFNVIQTVGICVRFIQIYVSTIRVIRHCHKTEQLTMKYYHIANNDLINIPFFHKNKNNNNNNNSNQSKQTMPFPVLSLILLLLRYATVVVVLWCLSFFFWFACFFFVCALICPTCVAFVHVHSRNV